MWKNHLIQLLFIIGLLTQANCEKKVIVEGDIVVTENVANIMQNQQKESSKRDAIKDHIYRWPDGIIPYVFSNEIDESFQKLIKDAFDEYRKLTCIRFAEKSRLDKDYVEFVIEDGCYSSIGRQGGRQTISLGEGCRTYGHVLHELMHCIGFFHEQSRYDRDLYVRILWWNIADGAFKNFASYGHGRLDTLGAPYDKHSILHYDNEAFTKNGGNTIESIDDPSEVLGREDLSKIDVYQINKLYKCHTGACLDKYKGCERYANSEFNCYSKLETLAKICPKSCGLC